MQCDIAIVGAGPAGTTAARILAKNSFNVILTEKKQVPKEKICGGMLTPRVFERFADLRGKMKELVVSTSYGACLYPPSMKSNLQHTSTNPVVFMVLRKKFDYSLLQMAMDHGAELVTNRVRSLVIKPDVAQILLDNNTTIESKVVIGADGVGSIVAWVCLMTKHRRLTEWLVMQLIKQVSTLRVSGKKQKRSPRLVFKHGKQDGQIQGFLKYRKQIKQIIRKTKLKKGVAEVPDTDV